MAKAKKIEKYVPDTKIPASRREWRLLDGVEKYNDFQYCMNLYDAHVVKGNSYYGNYYKTFIDMFAAEPEKLSQWKDILGSWRVQGLYNTIFPYTEEAKSIDVAFMAEFDSRDDLQEIYSLAVDKQWCVYDSTGNRWDRQQLPAKGWNKRPESWQMWRSAVVGCAAAQEKIELARKTPYQEGDLVLLRKPYIGSKIDPMLVPAYSDEYANGQRTPDESVLRLGTVYAVTERTARYWSAKGSKVIQIQWMGKDTWEDIEEKYIKWHMRPTYKNGMKVRPEGEGE